MSMKCCINLRTLFCMTMPKRLLDSKLCFCNRLRSEIPTKISEEAQVVMRLSVFHWSIPDKSCYIYVNVTMKWFHLSISKDHRLFKSIFTNTISNRVFLLGSGLSFLGGRRGREVGWLVGVFFPLKAGLHY